MGPESGSRCGSRSEPLRLSPGPGFVDHLPDDTVAVGRNASRTSAARRAPPPTGRPSRCCTAGTAAAAADQPARQQTSCSQHYAEAAPAEVMQPPAALPSWEQPRLLQSGQVLQRAFTDMGDLPSTSYWPISTRTSMLADVAYMPVRMPTGRRCAADRARRTSRCTHPGHGLRCAVTAVVR
jgi:hypothetical protein